MAREPPGCPVTSLLGLETCMRWRRMATGGRCVSLCGCRAGWTWVRSRKPGADTTALLHEGFSPPPRVHLSVSGIAFCF